MNKIEDISKRTGNAIVETIRENPLPSMLLGAGLAWMVGSMIKDHASDTDDHIESMYDDHSSRLKDLPGKVSDGLHSAADTARSQARHLKRQTREAASTTVEKTVDTFEDHPLAFGAAAIAAGALVGLLIPATRPEDRLLGEYRDRLVDNVKHAGEEVAERAQHVAETAVETLDDEARKQVKSARAEHRKPTGNAVG